MERPFIGVMAGVLFNGLRPLDLAAVDDPRTSLESDVHQLKNGITFDYRDQHPDLFSEEAMKKMMESMSPYNRDPGLINGGSGISDFVTESVLTEDKCVLLLNFDINISSSNLS